MADLSRGIGDAKEQWIRDQRVQAEASRRARTARLVTWILPGFGHLLRGEPIRGLVFLTTVFGSIIVATGLHHVSHDAYQPLGLFTGRLALLGLVAGIAWLLAVIDTHARSRK